MKIKRKISFAVKSISVLLLLFSLLILVFSLVFRSDKGLSLFGHRMYYITSGSMEPTFEIGTVVFVKEIDSDKLEIGDIISFFSSDPDIAGEINTHRITDIKVDNGERIFTTAGDAHIENGKVVDDKYAVQEKDIIGKVVKSSKTVGKVLALLRNRTVSFFLMIFPLLIIVIIYFVEFVVSIYRPYNDKNSDNKE